MPSPPKATNNNLVITYRVGVWTDGEAVFSGSENSLQCIASSWDNSEEGRTLNGKALCDVGDNLSPLSTGGQITFDAFVPLASGLTFEGKTNLPIAFKIQEVAAIVVPREEYGIITGWRHRSQVDNFQVETLTVTKGIRVAD